MCNQVCKNCHYNEINPSEDDRHCYMFRHEPKGDCKQFKLSKTADKSLQETLNNQPKVA